MSVTFSSDLPITGWTANGWCAAWQDGGTTGAVLAEVDAAARAHANECERCREYGTWTWPQETVESVNFSNTNAAIVLSQLGYDTDQLVGKTDASELLRRTSEEAPYDGDHDRIERLQSLARETLQAGGTSILWG